MSKHSPGPWRKQGSMLVANDGTDVVAAGLGLGLGADNGDGVREANSRVIKASPMLYMALVWHRDALDLGDVAFYVKHGFNISEIMPKTRELLRQVDDIEDKPQYLIAHIGHTKKSDEHITWWRPDSKGYTYCIDKAGLYTEQKARDICFYGACIAVTKNVAEALFRTTPYYRRENGSLNRLYDGGSMRVVENSSESWAALMAKRLKVGDGKCEKPTPIGAKRRAIYLPEGVSL
ncbi:hypothetical protein [Rhodoferax mekongensis]|uniref:Uncharacterized protein n=1 Tax=Rhodoferax mekongensis TaxID=3068341 RepID=A0ABZ0B551_9BURK|nr:hypothetical protein [Rhodoferax sp. TBRC 17307]WNO06002.1 hypothetical protein RAN89_06120 [Rhodoferax sp. TBRC 17307]